MTVTNIVPPEGVWFGSELEALGVTGYDEGDDLPEEYRELITQVVMVQADLESELVFDSSLLRHNILAAPDPRGRMRMAKFFAEEVRHGYTFWRIAKGLGVELTGRYFREAKRKRQEAFDHIGAVSDWTELAIVNTLTDRMGVFVFKDMADCSYRPWAQVSLDVARDEVGHTALGYANLREADREAGRARSRPALAREVVPDDARHVRPVRVRPAVALRRLGHQAVGQRGAPAQLRRGDQPAARASSGWSRPTTSSTATSSDGRPSCDERLRDDHDQLERPGGAGRRPAGRPPPGRPAGPRRRRAPGASSTGLDGVETSGAPGPGRLRSPPSDVALGCLSPPCSTRCLDPSTPALDEGWIRAVLFDHAIDDWVDLGPDPIRRRHVGQIYADHVGAAYAAWKWLSDRAGTDIDTPPAAQPAPEALALGGRRHRLDAS